MRRILPLRHMRASPLTSPSPDTSAHLPADQPEATRAWRDPGITAAERVSFLEYTAAPQNLRRAFWLLLVYLPVTIAGLIYNSTTVHAAELNFFGYLDVACSSAFFFLIIYLRRHSATIPWKRHFLVLFYIYNIGLMAAYYFAALPFFGETTYYTLGLLMMALLVRLPPRQFLPIFLVAHVIYCLLLLRFTSGPAFTSGLFTGTNALILATLAAWFLFHHKWDTYEKGRVITERNRQLAAANARLNEVTAIAAHDLRSPIASVLSYIHILQTEDEWSREPYRSTLSELNNILDGTLHLIGRMLHAHDAESQPAPHTYQTIELTDLVRRSIARLQHSATAKNITLVAEAATPIRLQTAPEVLDQALDNLISNAIKFSPLHSRVLISLEHTSSYCQISVQDSGPGIPADEIGKLFTKFHRGRNKPTAGEATSGIGLFIVQQLMTLLHGSVAYEPTHPTGSTFILRLPLGSSAKAK